MNDLTRSSAQEPAPASVPLPQRLSEAREKAGLSLEDVAQALHLPVRTVLALESGNTDALGATVFVRGHLLSYARLVSVPTVLVERYLAERSPPEPVLVATGAVPRTRYLMERYARVASYLIWTALIGSSIWWVATTQFGQRERPRTASLEPAVPTVSSATPEIQLSAPLPEESRVSQEDELLPPFVASFAPVSSGVAEDYPAPAADLVAQGLASVTQAAATEEPISTEQTSVPATAVPAGRLVLSAVEDSWVEVIDSAGARLHYGIIKAGTDVSFDGNSELSLKIGNAGGTRIVLDGKPFDLAPFRQGNVARLTLFDAESARVPATN